MNLKSFKIHVPKAHHDKLRDRIRELANVDLNPDQVSGSLSDPKTGDVMSFRLEGENIVFTPASKVGDMPALQDRIATEIEQLLMK